ncbi:MAG: glycosyltransferase family 4 protein [Gaiellaceae bacterium]
MEATGARRGAVRVSVFSTYFWPEQFGPAPYVTEPIRHLADHGYEVDVWTGFPHYPAWRPLQRRLLADKSALGSITVHRHFHYIPSSQSAAKRAVYEASLGLGALPSLLSRSPPDVVLGVTPTLSGALVAAGAARRFRAPLGLIVHDLMGNAAEQSGVAGGANVAAVVRRVEWAVARRAERIGIIADGFRDYFASAGVPEEKIVRLRTWTLGGAGPDAARESTRSRLGWGADESVFVHAGNMGQKQGLENVLAAAAILAAEPVRFVLAGDGNDRPQLEDRARKLRLRNVLFLGNAPWGEYEALLAAADVLLVNQRASVGDMSLPSKLTSYFAAGRPTIAAVAPGSETAREVLGAEAGLVVPPDDPPALAAALRRLAADPDLQEEIGSRARRFAEANLDRAVVLPQYEAFVRALR